VKCEILPFEGVTDLPIEVSNVSNDIPDNLQSLIWFGVNEDGDFIGGSSVSVADSIVLLERAKNKLMRQYDD
jgi:hypothetical protein